MAAPVQTHESHHHHHRHLISLTKPAHGLCRFESFVVADWSLRQRSGFWWQWECLTPPLHRLACWRSAQLPWQWPSLWNTLQIGHCSALHGWLFGHHLTWQILARLVRSSLKPPQVSLGGAALLEGGRKCHPLASCPQSEKAWHTDSSDYCGPHAAVKPSPESTVAWALEKEKQ